MSLGLVTSGNRERVRSRDRPLRPPRSLLRRRLLRGHPREEAAPGAPHPRARAAVRRGFDRGLRRRPARGHPDGPESRHVHHRRRERVRAAGDSGGGGARSGASRCFASSRELRDLGHSASSVRRPRSGRHRDSSHRPMVRLEVPGTGSRDDRGADPPGVRSAWIGDNPGCFIELDLDRESTPPMDEEKIYFALLRESPRNRGPAVSDN